MTPSIAVVTGGAGFIGAAISAALADRFDLVIAFDNFLPQVHPTDEPAYGLDSRVKIVRGDVTNHRDWDSLLSTYSPSLIVHLAAETGTGQSLTESARHTAANVLGTSVMLDELQKHQTIPDRIILTSSRAVYGEGKWQRKNTEFFYPGPRPLAMFKNKMWDYPDASPCPMSSETTERRPASVYGVTKSAQEDLLKIWCDAFGTQLGILRLQNVYGIGQTPSNPYTGIMSLFCRLASAGKAIPLYEDGNMIRDFVHISDVARAVIRAVDVSKLPSNAMDVGSGKSTTIAQAAQIISAIFNAPTPVITEEWRHGDVRHAWADPLPAATHLGFTSTVDIQTGLQELATWISSTYHL